MLAKLVDHKGDELWVNPIYVRLLREKKGITEMLLTSGPGASTGVVKIPQPLDEVAMTLNIAMVDPNELTPPENQAGGDAGSNAAISAALG